MERKKKKKKTSSSTLQEPIPAEQLKQKSAGWGRRGPNRFGYRSLSSKNRVVQMAAFRCASSLWVPFSGLVLKEKNPPPPIFGGLHFGGLLGVPFWGYPAVSAVFGSSHLWRNSREPWRDKLRVEIRELDPSQCWCSFEPSW